MKLKALTAVLLLLAFPVAVSAHQTSDPDTTTVVVQGEKANPSHAWFKAESAHFIVYSDTRHADVARLIADMERFRFVLRTVSQIADMPEPKFTLYYFTDRRDIRIIDPNLPREGIGLYTNCENSVAGFVMHADYTAKPDVPVTDQPEDSGLVYAQQAYARHFFYHSFSRRTPLWYIEGYAQYFSSMRYETDTAIVGLAPQTPGVLLSLIDRNRAKPMLDYRDVLIDDARYQADLTKGAYTRDRPARAGDASRGDSLRSDDRYGGDLEAAALRTEAEFEARSWLLAHWVLSSPTNMQKLQTYLSALDRGETAPIAFRKTFDLNPAQLDGHMRHYLRGDLPAGRWMAQLPATQPVYNDLPPAAEKLLLWNAAVEACPTEAYGKNLLGDIRSEANRFPDSDLAQMIAARAEIAFGDPARALPWLVQQTATHPDMFEAQHLLGRAELAVAMTTTGDAQNDAIDAANRAFSRAAALNPTSAVNAYWYFRAQIISTETLTDDAAGAAVLAWRMAPEVDAYTFNAALVYAYAGKRTQALTMLQDIASNPRHSPWQQPARTWIAKLKDVATRRDILSAIRQSTVSQGQREWTLAGGELLGSEELDIAHGDMIRMHRETQPPTPGFTPKTSPDLGQRPAEQQ